MPSSDFKNHCISILSYWNKSIRSALIIRRKINIPLKTLYYNINKLKQINSLKHRGGNSRLHILSGIEKNAIGQYIRHNNEITVKEKLLTMYHSSAFISIICRYLHEHGYKNVLPTSTHMLTSDDKKRRVQ